MSERMKLISFASFTLLSALISSAFHQTGAGNDGTCRIVKIDLERKIKTYSLGKDPTTGQQQATWFEARTFCEIDGKTLATVESNEEHELFKSVINTNEEKYMIGNSNKTNWSFYWMDGTCLGRSVNRTFYWMTTSRPFSFQAWGKYEPNNEKGKEQCVNAIITHEMVYYGWNDGDCSEKHFFVCQTQRVQA